MHEGSAADAGGAAALVSGPNGAVAGLGPPGLPPRRFAARAPRKPPATNERLRVVLGQQPFMPSAPPVGAVPGGGATGGAAAAGREDDEEEGCSEDEQDELTRQAFLLRLAALVHPQSGAPQAHSGS